MNVSHADALVFYGATGDLAYKKIFPSLQAWCAAANSMFRSSASPRAGWNVDQLRPRARDSRNTAESILPHSTSYAEMLRYVAVDYIDPASLQAIRTELQGAHWRPSISLFRQQLFAPAVEQLVKSGCAKGARIVIKSRSGVTSCRRGISTDPPQSLLTKTSDLSNRSLPRQEAGE